MNARRLKQQLAAFAFSAMAAFTGYSQAGPLALSTVPLFLVTSVEPNVFFLVDDSGSMEWEVLVDGGNQGVGTGLHFGYYVFPTSNNGADKDFAGIPAYPYTIPHEEDGDTDNHGVWRLQNASYNVLYYDPTRTYEPWAGTDSNGVALYANASYPNAPVAPGSASTFDLDSTTGNYYNYRWDSGSWYYDNIYPATHYVWTDSDNDGEVDSADGFTRVRIQSTTTSYTTSANRTDCAAAPTCTYAEEMQNFANWFTYHRKRAYVAQAAIGEVLNQATGLRSGIYTYNNALQQSILSLSTTSGKAGLLSSLYAMSFRCDSSSCPGTPARDALIDLGGYFQGNDSPIETSSNGGTCQQNFNVIISDGFWNGALAVDGANTGDLDYDATIQNADSGGGDDPNNSDFDGGSYADSSFTTLADVAMYFYENDLDTNLANDVPTIDGVDEADHQHLVTYAVAFGLSGTLDPFDTETPGDATDTDPTDAGFSWPTLLLSARNTALTVDDMWHAAYNGRGEFLSASDPGALVSSLNTILAEVADRTASAASVAASAGFLDTETKLYQARFSSTDWDGQMVAFDLDTDGTVSSVLWDGACVLTGGLCETNGATYSGQDFDTGREILTIKPSGGSRGTGVPFRWPANPASPTASEIDTSQVALLKLNPETAATDSDAVGESRLEYLRGDPVSGFRGRTSLLGDIVHSDPVFVGEPSESYPDNLEPGLSYADFVSTYTNRTEILYVGANDGMLHGFNATDGNNGGQEEIAYVPGPVYRNLSRLTSIGYGSAVAHRYFVDAPPEARDAVIGSAWGTVLAGGMRGGGQGYYALNVTNPANFDESNAANLVLWEFNDTHDSDMGYGYGRPEIVKLNDDVDEDGDDDWAVVVTSGYNNTDTDGGADTNVSSTGNAVIWLLDVDDGSVLKKFDTGVGTADDPTAAGRPNGMGPVTAYDSNGDFKADTLYAGDMFGNVWKIDISSSDDSNWDFAFTSGSTKLPLFKTSDGTAPQPITTAIKVTKHPAYAGELAVFATGKYLEATDHSQISQQTQTLYGIWDRVGVTTSTFTRGHLLQQQISSENAFDADTQVRLTTNNPLVWYIASATGNPPNNAGAYLGWYMDLYDTANGNTDNYGERVASEPIVVKGLLINTSFVPSSEPCSFGGDSWLMVIDPFTGQRAPFSVFDLNRDNEFGSPDGSGADLDALPDGSGGYDVVSGLKVEGILVTPTVVRDSAKAIVHGYLTTSRGEDPTEQEVRFAKEAKFRQSWRQMWEEQ